LAGLFSQQILGLALEEPERKKSFFDEGKIGFLSAKSEIRIFIVFFFFSSKKE